MTARVLAVVTWPARWCGRKWAEADAYWASQGADLYRKDKP